MTDVCEKCGTRLVSVPCTHMSRCFAAHFGCPKCRSVPCAACKEPRQPEAMHGLCAKCQEAGAVWAARRALEVQIATGERHVEGN